MDGMKRLARFARTGIKGPVMFRKGMKIRLRSRAKKGKSRSRADAYGRRKGGRQGRRF